MNYSTTLRYNIALTCIRGMNLMLAKSLMGYTGNAENLFLENEKALQSVSGIKRDIFSSQARKNALEIADKEIEFIEKKQIIAIFFTDTSYPARLTECTKGKQSSMFKESSVLSVHDMQQTMAEDFVMTLSRLLLLYIRIRLS